jgi:hypothetical protein
MQIGRRPESVADPRKGRENLSLAPVSSTPEPSEVAGVPARPAKTSGTAHRPQGLLLGGEPRSRGRFSHAARRPPVRRTRAAGTHQGPSSRATQADARKRSCPQARGTGKILGPGRPPHRPPFRGVIVGVPGADSISRLEAATSSAAVTVTAPSTATVATTPSAAGRATTRGSVAAARYVGGSGGFRGAAPPLTCGFRVGREGLEPPTPCASCKCATNCANGPRPRD